MLPKCLRLFNEHAVDPKNENIKRDIELELDGKDDIDDIDVPPIQASIDRVNICKISQLFCLFNNIFIGYQKCNLHKVTNEGANSAMANTFSGRATRGLSAPHARGATLTALSDPHAHQQPRRECTR